MRFSSVVLLLVATAVLASGDRVLDSDSATVPHTFSKARSGQYESPAAARFLRDGKTTNAEERGVLSSLTEQAKSVVTKVKGSVQLGKWLVKEQSADEVFALLKLDDGLDNLLGNPKFKYWAIYVKAFNKQYPNNPVTMAGVLTKKYGDEALAKMIEVATRIPSQRDMATTLAGQQRALWKGAGESVDDVFTLLRLDKVDDIFDTLHTNAWYKYAYYVDAGGAKSVMLSVLTARYGDDGLAKLLSSTKPREANYIAKELRKARDEEWVRKGLTTDDVFKLLKLDDSAEKLLTNPVLGTWSSYLKILKGDKVDEEAAMLKTFTKFYGDEAVSKMIAAAKKVPSTEKLATRLQNAQFKQWLSGGKSTENVFKLLKLDENLDGLLVNPNLAVWMRYAGESNLKNPGQGKTMMETLTSFYGNEGLSKALEAAKKVTATKETASKLQTAQFEMWLKNRVKPSHIWSMLKMDKATWTTNPNAGVWREYSAFYKLNKPQ